MAVALATLTACAPGVDTAGAASEADTTQMKADAGLAAAAASPTMVDEIFTHLGQLQAAAEVNGGNRATGTPGYGASLDYVESVLRDAGYDTHRVRLAAAHDDPDTATVTVVGRDAPVISSVVAMVGTPEADEITGPLVTTHSANGCSRADYADAAGAVVLVQRGGCAFADKAQFAAQAQALAVLVQNNPGEGELRGDLIGRGDVVPTVGLSFEDGALLRSAAKSEEVVLRLTVEPGHSLVDVTDLVADWPESDGRDVVVLGAHLDSVAEGPGINDNASGVGAVLEVAIRLAEEGSASGLRVAFWDAGELGQLGSSAYLDSLSAGERERISAYLNLDMVASPNGQLGLYGEGAPLALIANELAGSAGLVIDPGSFSDHTPFSEAGIPVGGLHTGVAVPLGMTDEVFKDSTAPAPDPCNHLACDTLETVDQPVVRARLGMIAEAVVSVTRELLSGSAAPEDGGS